MKKIKTRKLTPNDRPNLNALPVGAIVRLPKGYVRILDNLAESPMAEWHPAHGLIGYAGICVKDEGDHLAWMKGDDVWFMPETIERVISLPADAPNPA